MSLTPHIAAPVETFFEETHDRDILERVAQRYAEEATALEPLGFTRFGAFSEISPAFSYIRQWSITAAMKRDGEVLTRRWPLRRVNTSPVWINRPQRSLAYGLGLGVMFYSQTAEGELVVSASWPGEDLQDAVRGVHKFYSQDLSTMSCREAAQLLFQGTNSPDIPATWQAHRERLEDIAGDPPALTATEGMDSFFSWLHRENEAMDARPSDS